MLGPVRSATALQAGVEKLLEAEAKRHNCNPVQLALAWLLQKSPVMLPIPGTANIAHLEQNMAAAKIQLSPEEWKKIEAAA